jgi:hypothetical protein
MSPDVFVPADPDDSQADQAAKVVCSGCVVISECRSYGLRWDLQGVWGGWNPKDRAHHRRMVALRNRIGVDNVPTDDGANDRSDSGREFRLDLAGRAGGFHPGENVAGGPGGDRLPSGGQFADVPGAGRGQVGYGPLRSGIDQGRHGTLRVNQGTDPDAGRQGEERADGAAEDRGDAEHQAQRDHGGHDRADQGGFVPEESFDAVHGTSLVVWLPETVDIALPVIEETA